MALGSAIKPANIVNRASALLTNMAHLPALNRLSGRHTATASLAKRSVASNSLDQPFYSRRRVPLADARAFVGRLFRANKRHHRRCSIFSWKVMTLDYKISAECRNRQNADKPLCALAGRLKLHRQAKESRGREWTYPTHRILRTIIF